MHTGIISTKTTGSLAEEAQNQLNLSPSWDSLLDSIEGLAYEAETGSAYWRVL